MFSWARCWISLLLVACMQVCYRLSLNFGSECTDCKPLSTGRQVQNIGSHVFCLESNSLSKVEHRFIKNCTIYSVRKCFAADSSLLVLYQCCSMLLISQYWEWKSYHFLWKPYSIMLQNLWLLSRISISMISQLQPHRNHKFYNYST